MFLATCRLDWACCFLQHGGMELKQIIKSAGGTLAVAQSIGRSHSTVSLWKRVPAPHVHIVSVLSGIPAWKIRPDVFPAPIDKENGA